MSSIVDKVEPIIRPIVEGEQCTLVDMEYIKEGPNWYLRVYADKEGGIDINDCALISEKISQELDKIRPDPFPKSYFLEVSSPGAERPLKNNNDLQEALGSYVHLDYYVPQAGEKFHEGDLLNVTKDSVTIEYNDKGRLKKLEINRKDIAKIRLAIKF